MKISVFILLFIQTINSLELSKYLRIFNWNIIYKFYFIEKSSSCQTALGMQSGSIPDSSISVSSSYDSNTVGLKASR